MKISRLLSPAFVIALVLLVGSAISLNVVMGAVKGFLIKKPVPLRQPLFGLSERFGPYRIHMIRGKKHKEPRLSPDIEKALGTKNYISWIFEDTRKDPDDPGHLMRLHLAYYTGSIDVVPHVPERCIFAGGSQRAMQSTRTFQINNPLLSPAVGDQAEGYTAVASLGQQVHLPDDEVPLRVIRFLDPREKVAPFVVTYVFAANGMFMSRAEEVRLQAFNLTDEYAYFCKIEVWPLGVGEIDKAVELTGDFLSYALPEIMVCLPDWAEVRAGNYPPDRD